MGFEGSKRPFLTLKRFKSDPKCVVLAGIELAFDMGRSKSHLGKNTRAEVEKRQVGCFLTQNERKNDVKTRFVRTKCARERHGGHESRAEFRGAGAPALQRGAAFVSTQGFVRRDSMFGTCAN